jgi:hypothetical protein
MFLRYLATQHYYSTRTLFQLGTSCQAGSPACYPILTQSADATPLGGHAYAVACALELQFPGQHYRSDTILRDGCIDIHFLGKLLNGEIPNLVETCCAIERTAKSLQNYVIRVTAKRKSEQSCAFNEGIKYREQNEEENISGGVAFDISH